MPRTCKKCPSVKTADLRSCTNGGSIEIESVLRLHKSLSRIRHRHGESYCSSRRLQSHSQTWVRIHPYSRQPNVPDASTAPHRMCTLCFPRTSSLCLIQFCRSRRRSKDRLHWPCTESRLTWSPLVAEELAKVAEGELAKVAACLEKMVAAIHTLPLHVQSPTSCSRDGSTEHTWNRCTNPCLRRNCTRWC